MTEQLKALAEAAKEKPLECHGEGIGWIISAEANLFKFACTPEIILELASLIPEKDDET